MKWWQRFDPEPKRVTIRVEPGLTEQHMTELFHEFNSKDHRVTMMGDRWLVVATHDKEPERWLKEREYVVKHEQYIDKRQSSQYLEIE